MDPKYVYKSPDVLWWQLLQPDLPLEPGKIRDSNRVMLLAALRDCGYQPLDLGIAADT